MNIDTRVAITKLIGILEHCRKRPLMYVAKVDVTHVHAFLMGIQMFYQACDLDIDSRGACERRGWRFSPDGGISHMRESGLSDDAIADELIEVELDALRAAIES